MPILSNGLQFWDFRRGSEAPPPPSPLGINVQHREGLIVQQWLQGSNAHDMSKNSVVDKSTTPGGCYLAEYPSPGAHCFVSTEMITWCATIEILRRGLSVNQGSEGEEHGKIINLWADRKEKDYSTEICILRKGRREFGLFWNWPSRQGVVVWSSRRRLHGGTRPDSSRRSGGFRRWNAAPEGCAIYIFGRDSSRESSKRSAKECQSYRIPLKSP